MNKLKSYEIDTLVEFAEDFVKAVITNENSPHVEDAVSLDKARKHLRNYIIELVGEEDG